MTESTDVPVIELAPFEWEYDETDKDANFKQEIAEYTRLNPLVTLGVMSRSINVPIGSIIRYVVAKWTNAGAAALMEIGPDMLTQMYETVKKAEQVGTDEAKLEAYAKVAPMISWLRVPLARPDYNANTRER